MTSCKLLATCNNMPKAGSTTERKPVSVRVPLDVWRVIKLAMVLRKETDQQAFVLPVLQEFADRLLQEEPELKDMVRLAKENEARKAGGGSPTASDPRAQASPKRRPS